MGYYEKWKEKKRLEKLRKQNGGEDNLPANTSKTADADSTGDLFDSSNNIVYQDYERRSRRSTIGFKQNQHEDMREFGQQFDHRFYKSSYGDVHDDVNEVVKGNIPYFDMHEANRYVQRRIEEWLTQMGYKQWEDNKKNVSQGNANAPTPANPYKVRVQNEKGSNNAFDQDMFRNRKSVVKNYMVNDIYSMYYSNDYDIKDLNTYQRKQWFGALSQLNNYALKVISQNNSVYSGIVTYHIIKNILMSKDRNDAVEGGGFGPRINDFLNDLGNGSFQPQDANGKALDPNSNNSMQEALDDAIKETSDEIRDRDKMDKIFGKSRGVGDERARSEVEKLITMNRIDVKVLSKFINGIIKNTKKHTGGAKPRYKEESVLEADEIEELLDLELVPFPALIEDISVHDIEYSQKFDVYVDFSGSMGSMVQIKATTKDDQTCEIQTSSLAKLIYYKMYCMNIIHKVYGFNSHPYELTHDDFMREEPSGGTTIENVIQQVEHKTKIPSLIISDLEDRIYTHSKNVFILGIEGTVSNHSDQAFQRFLSNGQVKILNNGFVQNYYEAFPQYKR